MMMLSIRVFCCVVFVSVENDDRKMRIKVEIKPMSPGTVSTGNVNDIRSSVKCLNITATPTVCHLQFVSAFPQCCQGLEECCFG